MSTSQIDKTYNWDKLEDHWYQHWLENGYFKGDPDSDKEPYSIVIPPPNVTGMLTMGHVLNNTIQDVLIRKARMEGKNACWIPGTDHASIATESKVVKMLEEQGISKDSLSRDEFMTHAWAWKEKYGGIIINQLKKLGCSCDWDRERFTMDEGYSRAVSEAFVQLYHKGLIYKGHRLVNWCPVSKSAISDEEVIHQEKNGKLWHFRYSITGTDDYLVVATTRPETMLGDTAVAVHPEDERYKNSIGKTVTLPLVGREIPIIGDTYVDKDFGTGCVKVTPAHDPNDFAMGERHDLEFINIMNDDASMNSEVPNKFQGLSRESARKAVVKEMEAEGCLDKVEDYSNNIGFSERGNVPIEFYISEQWYLKMDELAKPALDAVNDGQIKFHPAHWIKTYNHWMENIKDWCISRQLWWGHQIPVWYNKDNPQQLHVSVDGPEDPENWMQDEDVLDTWASSWLWPFAVHAWPEAEKNLKTFYPTDALVTGPDIIFFWVARMIMSGYEFLNDIPFKDVYFTSILRDETGKKFSKSLGNSPDPFDLFKEYGTDATRFGTMLMAPQGLDVLFSNSRLEIGRNFMNKLWNASRFVHMNLERGEAPKIDMESAVLDLPERWILSQLNQTAIRVNHQLDRFHFNEAAKAIYEFTWGDFCDWYIEIAKTRFYGDDPHKADVSRVVAIHVIKGILTLLHPYSPFITEEIWSYFRNDTDSDLIVSPWLNGNESQADTEADTSMGLLKEMVTAVRTIRSRMNVPPGKKADLVIRNVNGHQSNIESFDDIIKTLGRINKITIGTNLEKPDQSATAVVQKMELFVPLKGLIDLDQEIARLSKRLDELKGHLAGVEKKLANENFVNRAPQNVVAHEKQNLQDMTAEFDLVKANLDMLQ
ncbi:MAG: valine--tRNA ligase [Candidatus Marinimicrobia bacterium]|nr:valine--tRNA ligase [Candidatus Neomarinimicrobiota bacterium]